MKYFFGGVNGSGKTSVLRAIQEKRPGSALVRGSLRLMEWLGIPNDYDALRRFEQSFRDQQNDLFVTNLLDTWPEEKVLLFDSHYLNIVRGKVDHVTGPWLSRFDALVLISAPADVVFDRLELDAQLRDRALFREGMSEDECRKMYAAYAEETRKEFLHLAEKFSLPHIEIVNQQGEMHSAVEDFLKFATEVERP